MVLIARSEVQGMEKGHQVESVVDVGVRVQEDFKGAVVETGANEVGDGAAPTVEQKVVPTLFNRHSGRLSLYCRHARARADEHDPHSFASSLATRPKPTAH